MFFDYLTTGFWGVLIGFFATVIPGPIAVICVQRTLNSNQKLGFVSGLGAAFADTTYALVALFALTYVQSFIEGKEYWLTSIAGIIIMLIGFSIYMKKVRRPSSAGGVINTSYTSNFLSVFLLTIINPSYFFFFLIVFTAMNIAGDGMDLLSKTLFISGVFIGASSWWLLLTWFVNKLRKKFSMRSLWKLNRISGIVVIALGALAIIKVLVKLTKLLPPDIENLL